MQVTNEIVGYKVTIMGFDSAFSAAHRDLIFITLLGTDSAYPAGEIHLSSNPEPPSTSGGGGAPYRIKMWRPIGDYERVLEFLDKPTRKQIRFTDDSGPSAFLELE